MLANLLTFGKLRVPLLSPVLGLAVGLASAVKWLGFAGVAFLILGHWGLRLRASIGRKANRFHQANTMTPDVINRTVAWSEEIDLSPDTLYLRGVTTGSSQS